MGDIVAGPALRGNTVLNRGVLRRKAKCVPTERMQHIKTAHPLCPRNHVTDHVVPHVPHVGMPGRIGEHDQAVELLTFGILGHLERTGLPPMFLPLSLDKLGIVVAHGQPDQ